MEITSIVFAILVIAAFIVFYFIPERFRALFLALLSGLFIASYGIPLLCYVVGYGLINYFFGIYLGKSTHKKLVFWTGIIFNLLQLAVLKYYTFLFDPVFSIMDWNFSFSGFAAIIFPLGISFYTLQGIGYLINVSRGWEKPETHVFHFLLYVMFFPKFISGPIERSDKFLPQLKNIRVFDHPQVIIGLRIALFGFFKKIVIANQLGMIVNAAYTNVESVIGTSYWYIILLQPVYLYFDFSGYTDIAIGIAKIFGINLAKNFERPFLAENISVFWRRWHISLTNWFNDYIFRQVSFRSRKWGIYASVFAVFVTFTLFGIWHGAGWNYMVLGLVQAVAINYEYFTKPYRVRVFSKIPAFYRIWISRIITYGFFSFSLILFFSPNLQTAISLLGELFTGHQLFKISISKWVLMFAVLCALVVLLLELLYNDHIHLYNKIEKYWSRSRVLRWIFYFVIIVLIIIFIPNTSQFIYQQF